MTHPTRILTVFLLSIIFISCSDKASMPGKSFEGKIVQQFSMNLGDLAGQGQKHDSAVTAPSVNSGVGLNATVTMYVRGDKVAYNIGLLGGLFNAKTIIDRNARTMTIMTGKHAYVRSLRSGDAARGKLDDSINAHTDLLDSIDQMMPKPTGNKKVINGLDCEEYKGLYKGMDMDLWITQDPRLKFYDVIRDAFLGRKRTGEGGMEQLVALLKPIAGEGKVTVKMNVSKDGKTVMSSELKEMSEEKVDDATFQVPKDFEIIKEDQEKK